MYLKRIIYLILISVLAFQQVKGQPSSINVSVQLDKLFGRLLKVNEDSLRLQINDSIKTIIDGYTESDSIFRHRFNNLRFIGQITAPDSLIKIVTWNLFLRKQPGQYFCYLIRKMPESKNLVYKLHTEYDSSAVDREIYFSKDTWYGALYYDIRPQIINGTECWVLLGIDYGNPEIARKIIEVLSFSKDDSIIFGMKAFLTDDKVRFREVFEYSLTATMTLRFGGDDSIIFDHLVPFAPEYENDRRFYGPQYTNDAYVLENGFWKLHLNIDARNREIIKPEK